MKILKKNLFISKPNAKKAEAAFDMLKAKSESKSLAYNFRILIVDDDREDVMLLEEYIEDEFAKEQYSFDIVSVADFEEAMNLLSSEEFDLALIDFRLGYRTGLDLLHEIKQKGLEVPVIFVTGQGDEHTAADAFKSGALDSVIKSDLSQELVGELLKSVIENKQEVVDAEQDAKEASGKLQEDVRKIFAKTGSEAKAKSKVKTAPSYTLFLNLDKLFNALAKKAQ